MSFTEFTYQLIQGYDFLHLNKEHNCLLQMGGSDQWGNITTGTELIRKLTNKDAFAMTCPLLTKADGTKFGKSEGGNIWLDKDKTSVYKFYQFWINTDDNDAEKYIKIFTFLDKETIDNLIEEHNKAKNLFLLQKTLAREITIMVHGQQEFEKAVEVSKILFNDGNLHSLDDETILDIFSGLPMANVPMEEIVNGISMTDILFKTGFLKSNNEARRALKENSVAINKIKREEIYIVTDGDLINDKFIIVQRGKKNYFLVVAS
jgi:tyrosyl-tRNA synthetase